MLFRMFREDKDIDPDRNTCHLVRLTGTYDNERLLTVPWVAPKARSVLVSMARLSVHGSKPVLALSKGDLPDYGTIRLKPIS